ncbi:Signal transduction histidine kinase CheA [Chitinispirillum alkaliphilum]|nr:Signal transduction histidine kinase CheA [Chitinispirillum alkaliphilum]
MSVHYIKKWHTTSGKKVYSMLETDREMLNELIIESREHLEAIEPDLLELEKKGSSVSPELINRVFRAVHSIKGGFGFFGVTTIVNLSHAMENVMSRVREKAIEVTPEMTDALLQGIDKLSTLLNDVSDSENVPVSEEIDKLSPFLGGTAQSLSGKTQMSDSGLGDKNDPGSKFSMLTDEIYADVIKNGKLLYQVTVVPKTDLSNLNPSDLFKEWEKYGEIIQTVPEREYVLNVKEIMQCEEILVLYSTVLEPDLINECLGLNCERILCVDTDKYRNKANNSLDTELEAANGIAAPNGEKKSSSRIEDVLRVKVSLLNSLMNNAGELVLARNQLLQFIGRPFSHLQESQEFSSEIVNAIIKTLESRNLLKSLQNQEGLQEELNEAVLSSMNFKLNDIQGVNTIVQGVDMVTTVLQEGIMQTRMQPISVVFSKFPRIIRDLAKNLGKKINLVQIGQDVELDKSVIELLSDPLTHLIRNCADHGIESVEKRKNAGKDETGQVVLKAYHEGGKVIIEIDDDGAGIDCEKVKQKALDKGIITADQAKKITDQDARMLIFSAGFSTAEKVTDVSGRGVGMDVVRTNIERLGGTIELQSDLGDGTRIVLKLPLTLAIVPSLIVVCEGRKFAVPQVGLEEVVRVRAKDLTSQIEKIHNSEILRLRGKLLPLVRLSEVLGLIPTFIHPVTGRREIDKRSRLSDRRGTPDQQNKETDSGLSEKRSGKKDRRESVKNAVKILVLKIDKKRYGLIVGDILESEEIVVKPLPEFLKENQCYAGATIMGDGKVAMIIDAGGISNMAKLSFDEVDKALRDDPTNTLHSENIQEMLIFSLGGKESLAIGLDEIARIEKRNLSEIEFVGGKQFVQTGDTALEIIRLDQHMSISAGEENCDNSIFLIVPKNTPRPMGFVAAAVCDTVKSVFALNRENVKGVGIKGTQIINEKLTLVLDVPALIEASVD